MNVMPVFLLAAQLAVFQNSPTPQEPDVPPGSLSGQVVNALTGEPVSGARVMVQCASRNSGYSQAVSDRGGMFNAAGLGPGSCTDRKSTRLNSSHYSPSRMPSSA